MNDNFLLSSELQHITTTELNPISFPGYYFMQDTYVYFKLILASNGYYQVSYSWDRVNLLDYAGNFTSQALSILAFVSFLMAGINRHAQNNNLINRLYGETSSSDHRTFSAQNETVAAPYANAVFKH